MTTASGDMSAEVRAIDDAIKLAKRTFNGIVVVSAFALLIILKTGDASLLMNNPGTALPIVGIGIRTVSFYKIVPWVLLCLYCWLQFQLQHVWRRLGRYLADHGELSEIDERVHPWIILSVLRFHVARSDPSEQRPYSWWEARLSSYLVWWAIPALLLLFWFWYIPRHDVGWSVFCHVVPLLLSIVAWFFSYQAARRTLHRSGRLPASTGWRVRTWMLLKPAGWQVTVPLVLLFVVLIAISRTSACGNIAWSFRLLQWGSIILCALLGVMAWRFWRTCPPGETHKWIVFLLTGAATLLVVVAVFAGQRRYRDIVERRFVADLEGQSLSIPPEGWTGREILLVKGADLHGRNLRGARMRYRILARANLISADLRDADLSHVGLQNAALDSADLTGAILNFASLQGAYLGGARAQPESMWGANVSGVRGVPVGFCSPGGFIAWAIGTMHADTMTHEQWLAQEWWKTPGYKRAEREWMRSTMHESSSEP